MGLTQERLERLIARSTDIVVATDRKGIVVYYNDGAKRILGYEPEEVLGSFVGRLYPSVEEAKRVARALRSSAPAGDGAVETLETRFVSKSGEQIPVTIAGTLLHDEQGNEDGTIGFAKDLREILRKDKLATLGEVAIGLSHEINNPMAVIVNQVELLERDIERRAGEEDCSVECERLDAIRREIGRVTEILDRLGEMAREETYQTVGYAGSARMVDLRRHGSQVVTRDPRLEGLRVLVVDDDLGISASLAEILSAWGCAVETAGDGQEALQKLRDGHFQLVLTDVVMPRMDGYELYREIQVRHPELPVLMMTAFHYDRDHIIKRSRLLGLEGVIFKKPVDPARLHQAILDLAVPEKKPEPTGQA
jgi:PAS domain S-box-containing protein